MRLTLSPTDSARWESGGHDQWQVEEVVLEWADSHDIREPIVVALDNGQVAFAFSVGGDV